MAARVSGEAPRRGCRCRQSCLQVIAPRWGAPRRGGSPRAAHPCNVSPGQPAGGCPESGEESRLTLEIVITGKSISPVVCAGHPARWKGARAVKMGPWREGLIWAEILKYLQWIYNACGLLSLCMVQIKNETKCSIPLPQGWMQPRD